MLMDTVKELCLLDGISGREDAVRAYIREKAAPYADSLRTDSLGNLIVLKKGTKGGGPKLMVAAHMDEVGLIVRHIEEDGFLRFACVGGIDRRVLLSKRVRVGEKKIPGVIGLKPIHLTTKEEEKKTPKVSELYIDIGAKSREEAEKLVRPGDFAAFTGDVVLFGDGFIKAKALDDRIGCAMMLKLLKEECSADRTFVFTVQEEIGCRGAFGAAFSVTPDIALVLETTTAADLAGVPDRKKVCSPGKGPVILYMDNGSMADRQLYALCRETAEKNGIPWQTKHLLAGGNDASAIQRSKAGVRTLVLSAAVRYLHAPSSVGSVNDIQDMLKLARLFLAAAAEEGK